MRHKFKSREQQYITIKKYAKCLPNKYGNRKFLSSKDKEELDIADFVEEINRIRVENELNIKNEKDFNNIFTDEIVDELDDLFNLDKNYNDDNIF